MVQFTEWGLIKEEENSLRSRMIPSSGTFRAWNVALEMSAKQRDQGVWSSAERPELLIKI